MQCHIVSGGRSWDCFFFYSTLSSLVMASPYVWKVSAPQIMLYTALDVVITSDTPGNSSVANICGKHRNCDLKQKYNGKRKGDHQNRLAFTTRSQTEAETTPGSS